MAPSHHDGDFQEFKDMFESEIDRNKSHYDKFLQYVQAQQLIRIADSLEKLTSQLSSFDERIDPVFYSQTWKDFIAKEKNR